MTAAQDRDVHQAAARAALAVPGVSVLQPGLADRPAAASRARHATGGAGALPPETGIRIERASGEGWRLEVRCVVHEGHRVLDVARQYAKTSASPSPHSSLSTAHPYRLPSS